MRSYCLVLVNLALVARDIATTLEGACLGVPWISTREAEAIEWLSQRNPKEKVRLAVVQSPAAEFLHSPLRQLLQQAGSKVILITDEIGQDRTPECSVLNLPFFTADLEGLLADLFGPHSNGRSSCVT